MALMTAGPLTLAEVRDLHRRWLAGSEFDIGYPNAVDFDVSMVQRLFDVTLNNVGHPFAPTSGFSGHSLPLEQQLIRELGVLFGWPPELVTGFVTSGSTSAIRAALLQARRRFRRHVVVYTSTAAHTCVAKVAEELCMRLQLVPAGLDGVMDVAALTELVAQRPAGAAVAVVATIGTTMVEAVDNIPAIHAALDAADVADDRRWVHADAALAGIPLAMLDSADRPRFDMVDSCNISGHKYLGIPMPCGAVLLRADRCLAADETPTYTGAPDLTPAGSRSGHTPLLMLAALRGFGMTGLRERAATCRRDAAALVELFTAADVPAWRHPLGFTVVLPAPSEQLRARWPLPPPDDGWTHVICMPGKRFEVYERFAREYLTDRRNTTSRHQSDHHAPDQPSSAPTPDADHREDAIAC
ncbi:histidine decarboxylase [Dactylosporangium siamense]|uniref:Histidine decarboxylase n=2 Tax=Dactylosporangium siamense TaxID=685454 RepID=A0A919Q0Y2_9ACTN|nr:histidine decarboxylase [Dactylosporangium siamense]